MGGVTAKVKRGSNKLARNRVSLIFNCREERNHNLEMNARAYYFLILRLQRLSIELKPDLTGLTCVFSVAIDTSTPLGKFDQQVLFRNGEETAKTKSIKCFPSSLVSCRFV